MRKIMSLIFAFGLFSVCLAGAPDPPKTAKPEAPKPSAPKKEAPKSTETKTAAATKADAPKADAAKADNAKTGDKKDDKDQGDGSSAFAEIMGDGTINARDYLKIDTDDKGNTTIHLHGGVVVDGENLKVSDCDDLVLDKGNNLMIAKGLGAKPLSFTKVDENGGKVSGTCGRLTNHLDTKVTILEGNPRVTQTNTDGGSTVMSGGVIKMTQGEKGTSVNIEEGAALEIKSNKEKKPASAATEKKVAPEKIDSKDDKSVRRIPGAPGVAN